ncbi:MAG: NAD-binding protein [Acholeplasmatales bacterium]|nr:NAD-binding protein [Acholeplasmatales bacterium]
MKKHRRRIFTKYHIIIFVTLLTIYMGLVVINYFALKNSGEDCSFIDVLWVDILTITGNDYEYITTPGARLIGIFFLILSLLFLSIVTGYISSLLVDRKLNSKRGLKRMQNLKKHIIICGWKNDIKSLILDILRKNKKLPIDQIVVVTNEDVDKIQALRDDAELKGLNILKGDYTLEQTLNNVSAKYASKVLILGENQENLDAELVDSRVFVTALMFRNINSRCHICAEIKTERYKNYLEAQNCAEVIYTDEYTRYILSTSTNYSGISKVLSSFLDNGDGKSVQIEKIADKWIGKPYIDLFNWYKQEKNILVIGILENMGVEKELKHEILAEAQKSTNYGEIIQKMRTVKTLETNHPLLNPSDDYILDRNMGVIIIGEEI